MNSFKTPNPVPQETFSSKGFDKNSILHICQSYQILQYEIEVYKNFFNSELSISIKSEEFFEKLQDGLILS